MSFTLSDSIVKRVTFTSIAAIFLGLMVLTIIASNKVYSIMSANEQTKVQSELRLLVESFQTFDATAKNAADKMANLFASMVGTVHVDAGKTVKVGEFETPTLISNGETMNLNFGRVDKFTEITKGSVATLFVRMGDDFVRVSTSLKKEDGTTRAIGTKLDRAHPGYKKVVEGEEFSGKAKLFGKDYMTKYVPVKENGKVVAVLFIGFDITQDLIKLLGKVKDIKIGQTGYYYILDAKAGETQGKFLFHPKLLGENGLGYKDADGREFIKDMMNSKEPQGVITYGWKNPDENAVQDKFAAYYHLKEWQWLIVGGTYLKEIEEEASSVRNLIIISGIVTLLFMSLIITVIVRRALLPLEEIQNGLLGFFRFLNRETTKAESIAVNTQDEFGQMAKVINDNIAIIERGLIADTKAVEETLKITAKVEQGFITDRIAAEPHNPQLIALRNSLNSMLDTFAFKVGQNLNEIERVLKAFATYNFTTSVANPHGEVDKAVNNLGNEINGMLLQAMENGLTLSESAVVLRGSMESLSSSSNQQASSLEETAAAVEELTSNIGANSQKALQMAGVAKEAQHSADNGKVLADNTMSAMNEINNATAMINEAVRVIDNIAFQTNILSLNAAVEAATAGEAGKGFAVVAQEVRNLANRSAEAAKQIKDLADVANKKAHEGLTISQEMISGFEDLSTKISQTTQLVQDVANASREQMAGIEQINDAITQLDQMTQQNARTANETDSVANEVSHLAEVLVKDAESKEFNGKEALMKQNHQIARKAIASSTAISSPKRTKALRD